MEKETYTATLTLTSVKDEDSVRFVLDFSHPRDKFGDEQPVAYQVMDFIAEQAVLPFAAIAAQLSALDETAPASDSVN